MPELPEVETTVRYLRERIVGLKIVAAKALWQRTVHPLSARALSVRPMSADAVLRQIEECRVDGVTRRGKFICVQLSSTEHSGQKLFWLCHLRMSGNLDVLSANIPIHSHDRFLISFTNGKDLRFNDPRKFGRVYLVRDPAVVLGDLGIEPLSKEFTPSLLKALLASRKGAIKPLLLNQRIVCGIGNIYADEALWHARIHPLTPASRIPAARVNDLHAAIQRVLGEAIDNQGTDAGDGVVTYGNYQPRVYGREGQRCRRCSGLIRKLTVGQRGTHVCPCCQRRCREEARKKPRHTRRKIRKC